MASSRRYSQDEDRDMPKGEVTKISSVHKPPSTNTSAKEANVNTPSAAWMCMRPKWTMISTLLAGTAAMRAAGPAYLPQHAYETQAAYDERLGRSTLRNYTAKTLEQLVGKAFKKIPQLAEDEDELWEEFVDDVDLQGNAFPVFARNWFEAAVAKSMAYVLVTQAVAQVPEGQEVRTLADDKKENIRPFWVLYQAEDVIDIRTQRVNGKSVITHARLREYAVEPNGPWETKIVPKVRVLTPGFWQLWRLVEVKNGREKWDVEEQGPMGLDFVPLVPFVINKTGEGEAKPPLEDLGYLNVDHWQGSSDQRIGLTVARFPLLAVSGVSPAEGGDPDVVIGPKRYLSVPDPQGKIYYVEHTGAALGAGQADLESIEQEMGSYAAQFLSKDTGTQTATARALDSAEAISPLKSWGNDFRDAMELAWVYTGAWMKIEAEKCPDVLFDVDDDLPIGDASALDALDKSRTRKDISRVAHISELKRRKILSEDYDPIEDQELIDSEPPPPGTGLDGMSQGLSGVPKKPTTPKPPKKEPAEE